MSCRHWHVLRGQERTGKLCAYCCFYEFNFQPTLCFYLDTSEKQSVESGGHAAKVKHFQLWDDFFPAAWVTFQLVSFSSLRGVDKEIGDDFLMTSDSEKLNMDLVEVAKWASRAGLSKRVRIVPDRNRASYGTGQMGLG
ncbi:hypothetical protein Tco_1454174 [Tanacetum coccineum]